MKSSGIENLVGHIRKEGRQIYFCMSSGDQHLFRMMMFCLKPAALVLIYSHIIIKKNQHLLLSACVMLKNNYSDMNYSSNYGWMTKKPIHTCYKHICVVSGCLDFCLSEGGGVYRQLSII